MSKLYPEYKQLNLPQIGKDVLSFWESNGVFEKSISTREGKAPFVFYEGPPSANGMPGIHHVMGRTIKDIYCRYHTLKGEQVKRKAGWDTHGLPIELAVEKTLGIKKEDIGTKISVDDYNQACRKEVLKYTDKWEELTRMMGYWVDMRNPYVTNDNKYIESVWWLLQNLYKKGLIYKGYTIQPYSPAAGTGLSSHELNMPGSYRNVKDKSAVAMFKIVESSKLKVEKLIDGNRAGVTKNDVFFLAWTTTPWTLPSNTALAVGKNITYVSVRTFNPFTGTPITAILAKDLVGKYFSEKNKELKFEEYKTGDKNIPFEILSEFKGSEIAGLEYEQLLPFVKPEGVAFKVLIGDFVTTEDGTGIVHIAPSFGADDFRVAKQNGIDSLTLVDKRGKFLREVQDGVFLFGDEFVKEAYLNDEEKQVEFEKQKRVLEANGKIKDLKVYLSVDDRIILKLQEEGKLFKKETYEHNYPHCWRTDKPVLYYPLDSWFVKTTALKDRMVELNKTIKWKPESTGTGRFGNWLENLQDWNLSRSRFWGIPLPIWRTKDGSEEKCIGSIEELTKELDKAKEKGIDSKFDIHASTFDLHRPYVDDIILVSSKGEPMYRETDLIDVWFDSGAMPYAQLHYPFENKELIDDKKYFPADFIAEGVDQTRGWFFTLHAIATMCFDSVAFKNVVSNGLVLDKNGNKMSKRLGNGIDPYQTLEKYGPDATRWYMITNASPWDNLKFDLEGIAEAQRKFFGTLYNTYTFFALYANIDNFQFDENKVTPITQRIELDRWIISKLHSLVKDVTRFMDDYDPTPAARAIENFVDEHLSNWYIRLSRRRFWKGELTADKKAAYETLYECLNVVAQLSSPFAPFFSDWLYKNLTSGAVKNASVFESVHLSYLTKANESLIDELLEEKMEIAQKVSSMVLSLRKKHKIRVRQPLGKIMIPILDAHFQHQLEAIKDLILAEVNVKELQYMKETDGILVKKIKPNFKSLGARAGKHMKAIAALVNGFGQSDISTIEKQGFIQLVIDANESFKLELADVEITSEDIPGWLVATDGKYTVALDITITDSLRQEGIAREIINRIQNLRKDKAFEVTDRIVLKIQSHNEIDTAISNNLNYICAETLASSLELVTTIPPQDGELIEVDDVVKTIISITKLN
ncbi:MAG: isoleucine--tRNA ligase [Bacteroidetes bacterium]|nr:isoleucine--tRNA ligase [Bacteroidota bacterium]